MSPLKPIEYTRLASDSSIAKAARDEPFHLPKQRKNTGASAKPRTSLQRTRRSVPFSPRLASQTGIRWLKSQVFCAFPCLWFRKDGKLPRRTFEKSRATVIIDLEKPMSRKELAIPAMFTDFRCKQEENKIPKSRIQALRTANVGYTPSMSRAMASSSPSVVKSSSRAMRLEPS